MLGGELISVIFHLLPQNVISMKAEHFSPFLPIPFYHCCCCSSNRGHTCLVVVLPRQGEGLSQASVAVPLCLLTWGHISFAVSLPHSGCDGWCGAHMCSVGITLFVVVLTCLTSPKSTLNSGVRGPKRQRSQSCASFTQETPEIVLLGY